MNETNKPEKKRELTPGERSSITRMKQKHKVNPVSVFLVTNQSENESLEIELAVDKTLENHDGYDLIDAHISEITGASNCDAGLQLLANLGKAIIPSKVERKEAVKLLNKAAVFMQDLAPQDAYEGQLIAQLVVLHEQAMDWLGRASRTERVDFANVYLNGASKLLTRHHETLDALLKYRRIGEQKVHVEHVHVNAGGQAIVGNVTPVVG